MLNQWAFAQKIISVKTNFPQCLIQGNKQEIKATIINHDTVEHTGTITLELIDVSTNKSVDGWFVNIFPFQYFTAAKDDSCIIKFPIQVPMSYTKKLKYRLVASSKIIKNEDDLKDIVSDTFENTSLVITKSKAANLKKKHKKSFG